MDKLSDKSIDDEIRATENASFSSKISNILKEFNKIKGTDKSLLLCDLILFAVGFLLSRCHLVFGAYPLGLAFVAMIPVGIWPSILGVAIGYLSMGIRGIIFSAVSVIAVILRASVSRDTKLFGDSLLVRMCIGVICGFISAVYEFLLYGLSETVLFFALSMIILTPLLIFALSGLFSTSFTVNELINGASLSFVGRDDKEKQSLIFFQISTLLLIFFISLSLVPVVIWGISLAYVFGALATLIVAKRFGALRAVAVGFVSTLSVSGLHSVGFALSGLGAGLIFGIGGMQAIIIGGAALSGWCVYVSGLGGLLSTLPEYIIASALAFPILKTVSDSTKKEQEAPSCNTAEDMVGTMALAYQNKYSGVTSSMGDALVAMSGAIKSYYKPSEALTVTEYRDMVIRISEEHCALCRGNGLCSKENIRPCIKNADNIADSLARGRQIIPADVNTSAEFCQMAELIAHRINKEVAKARQESLRQSELHTAAEEYELMAKLVDSAICLDDAERAVDNSLTSVLTEAIEKNGLEGGVIRAFGERRKHFFLAAEDTDGSRITNPKIRESIEGATAVSLATPEYFRKDKMVLMECGIKRSLSVSVGIAERAANHREISGDTAIFFENNDDYFYSLISDGMGSGQTAKDTSTFVCNFMKGALSAGVDKETLLHILNRKILAQKEECSATVDLFGIDLLTKEATFIKSGAAPSYIKRDSSIFRIRSQTTPIGLMKTIDCEKTKVEIRPGDHIIMLSDGIAEVSEDAPWLLLLLGEPAKRNLEEYARAILAEALKNNGARDDMSVIVIRIDEA